MQIAVLGVDSFAVSPSHIAVKVIVQVESTTLTLFSTGVHLDHEFYLHGKGNTIQSFWGAHEGLAQVFGKPAEQMRELWEELVRLVDHAQIAVVEIAEKHKSEVLATMIASVAL